MPCGAIDEPLVHPTSPTRSRIGLPPTLGGGTDIRPGGAHLGVASGVLHDGRMSTGWSDDPAAPVDERPPFRRSFALGIVGALLLAVAAAVLALASPTVSAGGSTWACWAPALGYDSSAGALPAEVVAACQTPVTSRLVMSLVLAVAALVLGAVTTIRATTVPRTER